MRLRINRFFFFGCNRCCCCCFFFVCRITKQLIEFNVSEMCTKEKRWNRQWMQTLNWIDSICSAIMPFTVNLYDHYRISLYLSHSENSDTVELLFPAVCEKSIWNWFLRRKKQKKKKYCAICFTKWFYVWRCLQCSVNKFALHLFGNWIHKHTKIDCIT